MKLLITIFKNIINPIAMGLVLLIGTLAAVLSGLIEYFVLKDWFSNAVIDGKNFTLTFLPIAIVVILEGSKLFLHFCVSAFKQNNSKQTTITTETIKVMNAVKYVLVIFSFMCTIIFTGNVLYQNSSVEVSAAYNSTVQAITNEYEIKIDNVKQEYKNNIDSSIEAYKTDWEEAQNRLTSFKIILSPKTAYERSIAEKKELENEVNRKFQLYQDALKKRNIDETQNPELKNSITALEKERDKKISTAKNESLNNTEGDNLYIKTFLLFIFNSFLNQNTYPKIIYFIISVIISLVIAGVLEAVIHISQKFISLPSSIMTSTFETVSVEEHLKRRITAITRIISSISISFFIFIIYGLIQDIAFDKFNFISAFICCIITVLIGFALPISEYKQPTTTSNNKVKIIQKSFNEFLNTEGKMMLIKGMLSFVGFIILGLIFEKNVSEITIPAVGVALGGALGNLFHIVPKPISI